MGNYLESALKLTAATQITDIFLGLLMALFCVAFVFAIVKKASRFVAYTPNMLTSIGILGTFIGIVIGLIAFDPANIDGSIEFLLAGLKTAFITSLAGMGLSILFKMLTTLPFMHQSAGKSGSSSNIGPELLTSMQKQNDQLDMLRNAIAGDEESSVAGQLKQLRSDANDHHTIQRKLLEENATALHSIRSTAEQQRKSFEEFAGKLWTQMEAFAVMLSKSATEQVIR